MTSNRSPALVLDVMRGEWESRAARDPIAASSAACAGCDATAFFASGTATFEAHVRDAMTQALEGHVRADAEVLDLGCGAGRLVPALLTAGVSVRGVDIAPSMVAAARRLLAGEPRFAAHVGDGMTLQVVRRHRFRFALAVDLFAWLPDDLLRNYLFRQVAGRLLPGGSLRFDVPADWNDARCAELLAFTGLTQVEPSTTTDRTRWTTVVRTT